MSGLVHVIIIPPVGQNLTRKTQPIEEALVWGVATWIMDITCQTVLNRVKKYPMQPLPPPSPSPLRASPSGLTTTGITTITRYQTKA